MKSKDEVCIVCENKRDNGIHVRTSFICGDCERDMVRTDTNDPKYIYYLQQLRKIEISYS
ncbi:carnitine--CoA ligase [Bacillus pseudomycoides]|uniref:Carnitine--CoA ligase n=1 Tax=Bacillus pseudomycoides TaxID=64104 RepID=A0AA91ZSL8_9BACI|nr:MULTISPECIES: sigma factor G inhibitor Gin [Bacillus]PEB52022.1 carnitine--CoA ligase [Bacillus sp. AFS098217]PED81880.1 carnitine--CoA ligase [Bacillus pseudomycoides]PEU15481.1 carnitine--CoA ligase [Bacillus sp. AFS019443]PEU18299.1 carnitine--CoA ligase [Bacillus sp. AFS014408]PFW61012.1 carnitine--CoA ligase [Bacillus sp. AFS075034]